MNLKIQIIYFFLKKYLTVEVNVQQILRKKPVIILQTSMINNTAIIKRK